MTIQLVDLLNDSVNLADHSLNASYLLRTAVFAGSLLSLLTPLQTHHTAREWHDLVDCGRER